MREHVFLPAARRVFDAANREDQRRLDDVIRMLCGNPGLGSPMRTLEDILPGVVYRYAEAAYYVVYDLPDEATVRIWMIGKGPETSPSR